MPLQYTHRCKSAGLHVSYLSTLVKGGPVPLDEPTTRLLEPIRSHDGTPSESGRSESINGVLHCHMIQGPAAGLPTAHLLFIGGTEGGHYIPLIKNGSASLAHLLPLCSPSPPAIASRADVLVALNSPPEKASLLHAIALFTATQHQQDDVALHNAQKTMESFCFPSS